MSSVRADVALLYRRAGFGANAAEIDAAAAAGYEATVEKLIGGLSEPDRAHPKLPHLTPYVDLQRGRGNSWNEHLELVDWWLDKIAATTTPLREKLTLLLHGQFPTGFSKVGVPIFMHRQNQLFRALGPGSFVELTLAVSKDPAMLIWLDADSDQRQAPNENFARELMERFTMGVGHYSQRDVEESAHAFTGWSVSRGGGFIQNEWAHDFGEKTFLGHHGDLDGEDVVRIVTNTQASARWVTSRMWSFLAYPVGTNDPIVTELAPVYARNHNMTALMRSIFLHPNFRSPKTRGGLVKQPIEWVGSILRGMKLRSASFHKLGGSGYLLGVFSNLGQVPFDPPSVGGWGDNEYWLSTASSLSQLNFAQNIAQVADLTPIEDAAGPDRLAVLGGMLGVDAWGERSTAVLNRVRDNSSAFVTLALTAPEVIAN